MLPTANPGIGTDGRCSRRIAWDSIRIPSPATLKVPVVVGVDRVPEHVEEVLARGGTAAAASNPSTVGITGSRKYDVIGLLTCGPMTLAQRSTVTRTSGRRRAKPRT